MNLCASFEFSVFKLIQNRIWRAIEYCNHDDINLKGVKLCGDIGANERLGQLVGNVCGARGLEVRSETRNVSSAIKIAWMGQELIK